MQRRLLNRRRADIDDDNNVGEQYQEDYLDGDVLDPDRKLSKKEILKLQKKQEK